MTLEKRTWVNEADLRYVFPKTPEEVRDLWPDALEVMKNLPHQPSPMFYNWIQQNPYAMIMIYLHDEPVMFVMREMPPGLDTVEGHGVVKKGMEKMGIQHHVQMRLMEDTFLNLNKNKVIIRFEKNNRSAKGFALRWGFRPAGEKNGYLYYVLTKDKYLERRDHIKRLFECSLKLAQADSTSV